MNPKLADIAVNLGHVNASALKDLVDFIRSGESSEAPAVESPAVAETPFPEVETPTEDAVETTEETLAAAE